MKLLLEEYLSRRLVPFLQHDYPGRTLVLLLVMESTIDNEVWLKVMDIYHITFTRGSYFQELTLV